MRSVLVLRALGLGDLLAALPALRALREAFGDRRLILAAPRPLAPLARLAGCVDEVVDAEPFAPLRGVDGPPRVAVNLHGKGPQSHRQLLALRPERLIAFANPEIPESRDGPQWDHREGSSGYFRPHRGDGYVVGGEGGVEHEVHRWCRLLESYGIPADRARLDLPAPDRPVPEAARGATVIHPGAASAARCWPPERWAAVARVESRRRNVIVTGGRAEVLLARRVAEIAGLGRSAVVAGATDLLDLAALIASAGRVLCGDTGVTHLATALGTPSIVLFGPISPARWGPPPDRPHHRVLWKGSEGDPHAAKVDPGLLRIEVDDVLRAVQELDQVREGVLGLDEISLTALEGRR